MTLLGTKRDEYCTSAKCRPGSKEKPAKRTHRIIRVRTSTVVLQCQRCLKKSARKTRRLDLVKKPLKMWRNR